MSEYALDTTRPITLPTDFEQSLVLPELHGSPYLIQDLERVLAKGDLLFREDGYLTASYGPPYSWMFTRDTIIAVLFGVEKSRKEWHKQIASTGCVAQALLKILAQINEEGELPQEFGSLEEGFPFGVVKGEIVKHGRNVDGDGWAMSYLANHYIENPDDDEFYRKTITEFKAMVRWAIKNVATHDGMIGYTSNNDGGSFEGTWMDGRNAILTDDEQLPSHPIAYVLEQALYWDALLTAAKVLKGDPLADQAQTAADTIKVSFNRLFVYDEPERGRGIARAVYGNNEKIHALVLDELVCLGFVNDGKTILDQEHEKYIPSIVRRLVSNLITPHGVLRTQAPDSPVIEGNEYHGPDSFWPFATIMAVQTIESIRNLPHIVNSPELSDELHHYALHIAQGVAGILIAVDHPVETLQMRGDTLTLYTETREDGSLFESSLIQLWTVALGKWLDYYLAANGVTSVVGPEKIMLRPVSK